MEVIWTGDYIFHDVYGSCRRDLIEVRMIGREKPLWKREKLGGIRRQVFFISFSHMKSANFIYDAIKSGENIPVIVQRTPPGFIRKEEAK